MTGVVALANRGTGANNAEEAAGQVLRSNATDYVRSAIQPADLPTLNQSAAGDAATATVLAATLSQCNGGQLASATVAIENANFQTPPGAPGGGTNWMIQTNNGFGGLQANAGGTLDISGNEIIRGSLTTGSGRSQADQWTPSLITVANMSPTLLYPFELIHGHDHDSDTRAPMLVFPLP